MHKAQIRIALQKITPWASEWRMIFNVKKSCVVVFSTPDRTQEPEKSKAAKQRRLNKTRNDHEDTLILCGEQLPEQSKMRYLGIIFDQNGKWDAHFDAVLSKVRFATHRICKIIRRGQALTMPLICDLIKTQIHPLVAYVFRLCTSTKHSRRS